MNMAYFVSKTSPITAVQQQADVDAPGVEFNGAVAGQRVLRNADKLEPIAVGDYVVLSEDGTKQLVPKAVFEAIFKPA
jgi:hypothetical protein